MPSKASSSEFIVFLLSSPYPKPSMSDIRIEYSLPEKNYVKLNLYGITGRLVKTLCSGNQNKGYYTVNIRSNELAKRVYFIKFSVGNCKATKRLTILK